MLRRNDRDTFLCNIIAFLTAGLLNIWKMTLYGLFRYILKGQPDMLGAVLLHFLKNSLRYDISRQQLIYEAFPFFIQ